MRKSLLCMSLTMLAAGVHAQFLHHNIHASINHEASEITVTDTLLFPPGFLKKNSPPEFTLNRNLTLQNSGKACLIEKLDRPEELKSLTYRIVPGSGKQGESSLILSYSGVINEAITTGAAEYARGFSETDGMIGPEGIYLAGATDWVPRFEKAGLFTFDLTVELDEPWNVVSQGTRSVNRAENGRRVVQYHSPEPMDEVFLVAGKWTEYSLPAGDILVQAFLRTPDEELANRYLGVTKYYLDLYTDLIGPYPYTKFALVENFWETGFGMPSFTLLGEKVIRFPWILHSSYPHELLHNYWGNSVYVDHNKGNWCEGITAYMADHLIKEQQGIAAEYRRTTLQKFTDYVNAENDFPPSEFISRNNPAGEAIGYGKVLMFNNMLRDAFGDEVFVKAYREFYKLNKFRLASFGDIRSCFEKVTGENLEAMFGQWINRKGAPSLVLSDVQVNRGPEGYVLSFKLDQVQEEDPFQLNIPVAIYLEGNEEVQFTRVSSGGRSTKVSLSFSNRPLKISIDPQFQLMRRLHRSEVPSTLSQLFGASQAVIIVPKNSALASEYMAMAEFWKDTQAAQGKELKILVDTDIEGLPGDMPFWVLGFENRFYDQISISEQYLKALTEKELEQISMLAKENALVYAIPCNLSPDLTIGFVGAHHTEAIAGLSRKLFHYGSYGYLGFEGDAPDNVLKGVFQVLNSRLDHVIPYPDQPEVSQILPVRKALSPVK
ncbi:MAG: M1 family aminopeptidase [Bacteroidota bacterium]